MTNNIEEMMKAAGLECSTPFTPAKQLELIKLLSGSDNFGLGILETSAHEYLMSVRYSLKDDPIRSCNEHFELALAEMALGLIKKNQLDKSEVKRILEDD